MNPPSEAVWAKSPLFRSADQVDPAAVGEEKAERFWSSAAGFIGPWDGPETTDGTLGARVVVEGLALSAAFPRQLTSDPSGFST